MAFRYPDHLQYNYEIVDHQGSVRQVVTNLKFMATATMETEAVTQMWEEEQSGFTNIASSRKQDPLWNTTPEGSHSAYLNPADPTSGGAVGPAKELRVSQGDVVRMSVQAAYIEPGTTNTFVPAIGAAIATGLGFAPANLEGGRYYTAISDAKAGLASLAGDANSSVPKAYLQFLFFDKDLNYVHDANAPNFVRVTNAASSGLSTPNHEELVLEYIVPEDGYMYIYVANESSNNVKVFFDDFTISQTGLLTVQACSTTDRYYPLRDGAEPLRKGKVPPRLPRCLQRRRYRARLEQLRA
jgi:hypothetical protein